MIVEDEVDGEFREGKVNVVIDDEVGCKCVATARWVANIVM